MARVPNRRLRLPRQPPAAYRRLTAHRATPAAAVKTGWDKAAILVQAIGALAIFVSLGALYEGVHQFNVQQKSSEAQALDQRRQATLNQYLDDMSVLVLQYDLPKSQPGTSARAIAEARTLTDVRDLDGSRKGTLIRYLWEARLIITPNPIVKLDNANLAGAVFGAADLEQVDLVQLGLNDANLAGAHMPGANLHDSFLIQANLSRAEISCFQPPARAAKKVCSDLRDTYLVGANMRGADLSGASLQGADLSGANLSGANLTDAKLGGAKYNSKPIVAKDARGQRVIEPPTQWPRGFNVKSSGIICENCK